MKQTEQPWIHSAWFDGCFILAPAIVTSLLAVIFSDTLQNITEMPPWLWLLLIVCIDAGHVYCSLFRTYFDKQCLAQQSGLLTLTPLLVWLVGCQLYSINALWFWRVLAYLAVFHFVRQQYGFMMIYARHERDLPKIYRTLDKLIIYASTLAPLIIWHSEGRSFNWFVNDDFILIEKPLITVIVHWLYGGLTLIYAAKEISLWRQNKRINWPRNFLIFGTALSWHIGIVSFDNDLIFTATNVIAHGIPYYALIWVYGYKLNQKKGNAYLASWLGKLFSWQTVSLYLSLLCGLAYLEESLWDGLVWREHPSLFGLTNLLTGVSSPQILTWLVPLLTVPQATHYVLDAFIWRLNVKPSDWKRILFS